MKIFVLLLSSLFFLILSMPVFAHDYESTFESGCDAKHNFKPLSGESILCEHQTDTPTNGDSGLGKIAPPAGVVTGVGADPSAFVAGLVRNSISLLLIVSFVIALIWTIINGLRFILANGDEKTIASAWSQIYWTLIGMAIVMGAFAIIKMVETFFGVEILSTTKFQLPTPT